MSGTSQHFQNMNNQDPAIEPPFCNHVNQVVDPRHVQYYPQYNDTNTSAHQMDQTISTAPYNAVTPAVVATHIESTYNTGDRVYYGDDAPSEQQIQWTLKLKPLQQYIRNCDTTAAAFTSKDELVAYDQNAANWPTEVASPYVDDQYANDIGPVHTKDVLDPLNIDFQLRGSFQGPHVATPLPNLVPFHTPQSHPLALTCEDCGSTKCNSLESLKRHKDREHGTNILVYVCPYFGCPKSYSSKKKTDVERHVDTFHLKKRPFACSICDKTFSRRDNYKRHLKAHV